MCIMSASIASILVSVLVYVCSSVHTLKRLKNLLYKMQF